MPIANLRLQTRKYLTLFALLFLAHSAAAQDNEESARARLRDLARKHQAEGRADLAEPLHRQRLDLVQRAFGPEHPETAAAMNDLGTALFALQRFEEAGSLYRKARAFGRYPQSIAILGNLSAVELTLGRLEPAKQHLRESLELAVRYNHPAVLSIQSNLANVHYLAGEYREAVKLYRAVLSVRRKALGPQDRGVALTMSSLGEVYRAQRRYADAEEMLRGAISIYQEAPKPHPEFATALNNLANLAIDRGRLDEAAMLLNRVLFMREEILGQHHAQTAAALSNLGLVLARQRQYEAAEKAHLRAIGVSEKALGSQHPEVGVYMNNLAVCYHAWQKYAMADERFVKALAILEPGLGLSHPKTLQALANYARFLRDTSRKTEADQIERRVGAALAARSKANPVEGMTIDYRDLGPKQKR